MPRSSWSISTAAEHRPGGASAGSVVACAVVTEASACGLHPSDYDRAGVGADGRVKVTSGNRSVVVAASVDASLPRGTASLAVGGDVAVVTFLLTAVAAGALHHGVKRPAMTAARMRMDR